jgi:hypothetical protein
LTAARRDQPVELRKARRSDVQPGVARSFGQGIGERPVFRGKIPVEMRGAKDILRARFAASCRCLDERHRILSPTGGEQDEPQIVFGLQMSLLRGAAIPGFGLTEIGGYAAPQLIGLAQIELRVGIAGQRERAPFGDGGGIVAALPGVDARFDVGLGRSSERKRRDGRKGDRKGGAKQAHEYLQ